MGIVKFETCLLQKWKSSRALDFTQGGRKNDTWSLGDRSVGFTGSILSETVQGGLTYSLSIMSYRGGTKDSTLGKNS